MEETLKEDVELELDIGREKFDSAMANLDSGRFRSATSDLCFSLEPPDLKAKIESLSNKLKGVLVLQGERVGSSDPEGE